LAYLFGEPRQPPLEFWALDLVGSRLVAFEIVTRCCAAGIDPKTDLLTRLMLDRIAFAPMTDSSLQRMFIPWPVKLRTLDAIHLATAHHLREHGVDLQVATYDSRLAEAALALGFLVIRP
jgi:PIN domain